MAPWGQSFTDVGGCGSDEQIGRRVITMADAIATAMTRASNRAVSNLIAMGEVSAEEIGDRTGNGGGGPASEAQMGLLAKLMRNPAVKEPERDKVQRWIEAGDVTKRGASKAIDYWQAKIAEREKGTRDSGEGSDFEERPSALDEEDDGLPF